MIIVKKKCQISSDSFNKEFSIINKFKFSKVWIYGTVDNPLNNVQILIDDSDAKNVNYQAVNPKKGSLLYESKKYELDEHKVEFKVRSFEGEMHYYYIYYEAIPSPTKSPAPKPTSSPVPTSTPLLCPLNCNHCSKTNICDKCNDGFLLYNNTCFTSCPKGTFELEDSCKDSFNLEAYGSYSFSLQPGIYQVECYGAQGGRAVFNGKCYDSYEGGKGAYAKGVMALANTTKIFAFIGCQCQCNGDLFGGTNRDTIQSGFNGGGNGGKGFTSATDQNGRSGGGGGATDLRIFDDSVSNRVIVAAGGSGAAILKSSYKIEGAPGGEKLGMAIVQTGRYTSNIETYFDPEYAASDEKGSDSLSGVGSGGGGCYF